MNYRYILYHLYRDLGSNYVSAHSVVFLVLLKIRCLELPDLVISFNSALEDVELPNYLDCHNVDSL